ncbi:DM13 domain-containing protein [Yeosuana sp. MJ-SS3]|uniref:DM13 domain-containing protein n=1 Tax=Gilvirhabdus luticola TaxID=3079858 RepID=A0ABU3UA87_9FLAO|nr:DM13 domain-containing protein [Yeosuana sp. MJ-SS3]MDU8886995.1 DM13 domain-containing protein [Yeosuana sp. MJ-SS3]
MKFKYSFFLLTLLILACSTNNDDDSQVNQNEETDIMEEVDLYEGSFVSAAHPTSGKAIVNEEHTILAFTNFKTDSGPILEVYLATDTNASDYISLGELQGIEGDFDYSLPEGVNFETHKFVLIWCVDFSVNFGHAILE